MKAFRSWSRRAYLLHGYLIAALVLHPCTFARTEWIDTDSDAVNDTWEDTANSTTYTLAQLDAINPSLDIDGDGATNSEELANGSDPFVLDTDGDGLNDGDEIHLANEQYNRGYSLTAWDSNGDDVSDHDDFYGCFSVTYPGGQLPAFSGATYSDYDGDGIKNPFDPYPTDPTNNDADGDGIDDSTDPALGDASNQSPYNGMAWYGNALGDDDGDAILNFWDQWPADPSNGSSDSDGDGIDNSSDPFPNDHSNYSPINGIYWYGDVFGDADWDGTSNYADAWPYDASNGASNDSDGDGIEDSLDPAPGDSSNYSSANGTNWYSYALEDADNDGTNNFNDPWPSDPYDNLPDFDGDGWSNENDPFPKDASNYSELNGTAWGAAMFEDADGDLIPNWQDEFPNDWYNNNPDYDGDGIANGEDPFPTDGSNYSEINQISWGSNVLGDDDSDGILNWEDPSPAAPTVVDSDGDGIPDSEDPAPGDSSNYSSYNNTNWYTYALSDDDADGTKNFWDAWPSDSTNGAGSSDRDWDGMLNENDPAPDDYSNYSPHNWQSWYGDALGDADNDGIANFYDYQPYGDGNVDTDGDGYLDSNDPAPNDWSNFSYVNGQWWYGYALNDDDGDGTANFYDDTPYGPQPADEDADGLNADEEAYHGTSDNDVDSDGDGLTDYEEVHMFGTNPTNAHHLSQQRFGNNLYTDWQLVDLTDTDGDQIPDRIEQHYGLNPNWPGDALLDRDNDGVNNLAQYNAGIALDAHLSVYDADGDGMTDVFEDAHAQVLSKSNPADAVLDADGDGVLNYEEQILLISPQNADTLQQGGLGDLQVLMLSVRYPDGSNPAPDDVTPQNGIPDWADAIKETPTAPDYHHFTRQLPGDLDGDGMPDAWEHEFGRWKFTTNGLQPRHDDAGGDADEDGLTNLSEYILGTNPLAGDSDDNGTNDKDEDFDADGLTNGQEIALGTNPLIADTDGDGVSDGQEVAEGTDPNDATSNSTTLLSLYFVTPLERVH